MSDTAQVDTSRRAAGVVQRTVDGALLAVAFLTILPVRLRASADTALARAAVWFPAVGALVGAIAGGVRAGADPLVGAAPASVLAVAALVVVTGGLHQDGLADCADGLGVRGDRARRLAVMRDSAIGTFGALALVGWALLAVAAVAELRPADAVAGLVAAAAAGRWAALLHAAACAPARADGLGAGFAVSRRATAAATLLAAAAAFALLPPGTAAALLAAALAAAALTTAWARRALGGRTGDTLGATVALAEVAALLVVVGFAAT